MSQIDETLGGSGFTVKALRAAGALVKVDAATFLQLLARTERPLVVHSPAKLLRRHRYLSPYRGMVFYTRSGSELELPGDIELVVSGGMWLPD